ncbi:hypothetical protein SCUCBS95973_005288 [Sporothrix curviconia]|uniref:Uncharacterized protein n=1 Tax=Sporothrix curviconia TaxID=1260050 RepID=A0ABP0BVU3_9PEZI
MPDHAPSAADADAAVNDRGSSSRTNNNNNNNNNSNNNNNDSGSRPPRTPTTPSRSFSGSFFSRLSPGRPSPGTTSLAQSFNLHALGFNTSPLGPLGRRISFYDGDSGEDGSDDDDRRLDGDSSLGHLEEDFNNDGSSSINGEGHRGGWQTSDDGDGSSNNNGYDGYDGLDDPIALEDRKDVLIDRLNDMVRHVTSYAPSSPSISNRSASTWNSPGKSASAASGGDPAAGASGGGAVFTELHAHIDKMEAVLAAEQAAEAAALAASPRMVQRHSRHHSQPNHYYGWQRPELRTMAGRASGHVRRVTLDAAPVLFRNQSAPLPDAASPSRLAAKRSESRGLPTVSSAVATNCDELAGDLSAVLGRLLKRREESEFIQEALLRQLAEANRRTLELEAQVKALTDERDARDDVGNNSSGGSSSGTATATATEKGDDTTADESLVSAGERLADLDEFRSELSFLRLQLRGIEVQCRSYVPADADPELTESIENWKADWFALRAKVDEERRSATASLTVSMSLLDQNNNSSMNDMNSTF